MKYAYEIGDWITDWSNLLEASTTVPIQDANEHLRKVFVARYPDVKEAQWRCNRVLAALRYMEANKEAFEKAGYLLASSKGGTVGSELSIMLCGFFGQVSDAEVSSPPAVETVIWTMQEFERITGGDLPKR
jgi:hypothetical protein